MSFALDVCAIGNAIVDIVVSCDDAFLERNGIAKSAMTLIDAQRANALYACIKPLLQCSGGSAANTAVGIASFGGKAAYMGRVSDDELGALFTRDMQIAGVTFDPPTVDNKVPTARCFSFVTPDAHRSMCTYLGSCTDFSSNDIDADIIRRSRVTYLEGYLFDKPAAQAAFKQAAAIVKEAGTTLALSLSDTFCVDRHRSAFMDLIRTDTGLLLMNEAELFALYETHDFDAALAQLRSDCPMAVVTRSEKGCVVATPKDLIACPAAPVFKLVDTTGAGDLFASGFLYGLTRDKSLPDCARLGALAAAEIISHPGARPQISLATLLS